MKSLLNCEILSSKNNQKFGISPKRPVIRVENETEQDDIDVQRYIKHIEHIEATKQMIFGNPVV